MQSSISPRSPMQQRAVQEGLEGPLATPSLSSLFFSPHCFGPRPFLPCITSTHLA